MIEAYISTMNFPSLNIFKLNTLYCSYLAV